MNIKPKETPSEINHCRMGHGGHCDEDTVIVHASAHTGPSPQESWLRSCVI